MEKVPRFIKVLLAIVVVIGFTLVGNQPAVIAEVPQQAESTNHVFIDVTYDPGTKSYSMGGFSAQELQQMGAPALTDSVWMYLSALDGVVIRFDGRSLSIDANDTQLGVIDWDPASRQLVYDLIGAYTTIGITDVGRIETWIDTADFEIALRNSKELSEPLEIALATLIQVSIAEQGELMVEGFPTGAALTPETLELLKNGEISTAKICWDKGVLTLDVNETTLPQVTLYEDGLSEISRSFGINLGDLGPYFNLKLGAGISYGEADPVTGECLP